MLQQQRSSPKQDLHRANRPKGPAMGAQDGAGLAAPRDGAERVARVGHTSAEEARLQLGGPEFIHF